jgi:hypothetical protein
MEERFCSNEGCGKKFKVLKTSKQAVCGATCFSTSPEDKKKLHRQMLATPNGSFRTRAQGPQKVIPIAQEIDHGEPPYLEGDIESHHGDAELEFKEHLEAPPTVINEKIEKEEVNEVDLDRWQSYVDRAKKIYRQINKDRIEIATLAIKACEIKHGGGDHWKNFEGVYTLRRFAEDIGISYKTLHNWVTAKLLIKDQVGDKWDDKNWGAAQRTRNKVNKKTKVSRVIEIYENEKVRKGPGITFHTMIKRLSQARHYLLHRMDKEDLSPEDMDKMESICKDVLAFLDLKRGKIKKHGITTPKLRTSSRASAKQIPRGVVAGKRSLKKGDRSRATAI